MIRQFAFVILDDSDLIVDRFNLDYVDGLSGLGFKLNVSTIETDVEDYITKVVQTKQNLGLTVHHLRGYVAGNELKLWLSKHIKDCMCIEYKTKERTSYIEGVVIQCDETELNEYKVLEQKITFKPLTPFFEKYDNDVRIQYSTEGQHYPFAYPYSYGQMVTQNNEIENAYIYEIPITVTLYGTMTNPSIKLLNSAGTVYNEVRFVDVDLGANEKIIINSAQRKIIYIDSNGAKTDYFNKINGAYDTYLRANPMDKSTIQITLAVSDTGYLVGSRRQYRL